MTATSALRLENAGLIVFDWDGTLMDSIARIVSAMQATARYMQLPEPSDGAVKDIIGISLEPAIERLFGRLPGSTYQQFLARYKDEYVELNSTPTPLFAGALDCLQQLRQYLHVTVATGKARRGLHRIWQELDLADYFDGSRCADESEGKPSPKMLHELMHDFDTTAARTVMVGDSIHDIGMAKAAGVTSIGVDFGAHSGDQLRAAGADYVVSDLAELTGILRSNIRLIEVE